MRATLTIVMDNEAFTDYPLDELARILRELATKCEGGANRMTARDYNGNKVGELIVEGI